jgi:hypothetical protein
MWVCFIGATLPPEYFASNVSGGAFLVLGWLNNINDFYLFWLCGSRTAGEALFFCSQKKHPKKPSLRLAPLEKQGSPLACNRYHAVKKLAKNAQTIFTESS